MVRCVILYSHISPTFVICFVWSRVFQRCLCPVVFVSQLSCSYCQMPRSPVKNMSLVFMRGFLSCSKRLRLLSESFQDLLRAVCCVAEVFPPASRIRWLSSLESMLTGALGEIQTLIILMFYGRQSGCGYGPMRPSPFFPARH